LNSHGWKKSSANGIRKKLVVAIVTAHKNCIDTVQEYHRIGPDMKKGRWACERYQQSTALFDRAIADFHRAIDDEPDQIAGLEASLAQMRADLKAESARVAVLEETITQLRKNLTVYSDKDESNTRKSKVLESAIYELKRLTSLKKEPADRTSVQGDSRKLIFIEDVSDMIGKTTTTIRTCATNIKYQHLIPRPFKMPGSRRLCWYEDEVLSWISLSFQVRPEAARRQPGRPTKREQLMRMAGTHSERKGDKREN
jgi:hypothetical protein